MNLNFLSLNKSKKASFLRKGFHTPELLALETRVNPVAFTANVLYSGSTIQVALTSTGINASANTLTITNSDLTTILLDAGAGNTITLTDQTNGALIVSGAGQIATIGTQSNAILGLKMVGNVGQDRYTFGNFNSASNPLTTAASFGVTIDAASISGANNQDTLTINGAIRVTGTGSFITSNSTPTQNLDQITINAAGQIKTIGSGNILLVANRGGTSNININGIASVNPFITTAFYNLETATTNPGDTNSSGSINLIAGQFINISGDALKSNGGAINLSSAAILTGATNIFTGVNKADVTFASTLNGSFDLTVNSTGSLNFQGNVGPATRLGNIITQSITGLNLLGANGTDAVSLRAASFNTAGGVKGNILFSGTQNYSTITGLDLAATKRSTTFLDAGAAGDITLNGAITMVANATLNLAHDGALNINANITNGKFTEVPTTTSGVTPIVNIGGNADVTINSNAAISFISPVNLNNNLILITSNGNNVTFNNTLDGPLGLTVNTTGALLFNSTVGATSTVGVISTTTNNPASLTFNNTLKVGTITATIQGNVNMTKDQVYLGGGLNLVTLSSASNIRLGKITATEASAASVSICNAGNLFINDNISVGGSFTQGPLLTSITLVNGGTGYTTYPTVTFANGGGSGAVAQSFLGISQNSFTPLTLQNAGINYAVGNIVSLNGTGIVGFNGTYFATATVTSVTNGGITGLTLLDGGKYSNLSSPNGLIGLTVVSSTGVGTGAILDASGFVNAVNLTSPGIGYTSAPTISFTGGGDSGINATAIANLVTPTGQVIIGNLGNSNLITIDAGLFLDITFTSAITLNQNLFLDASAEIVSNITLGPVEGGTLSLLPSITMITGGNLFFNGTIGATNPLGAIDASSNIVTSASSGSACLGINAASLSISATNDINLTAPQIYTGTALANGAVFGLNLSNISSSEEITLGTVTTREYFSGAVGSVIVNSGGSGYLTSPNVTITGVGSGATATSTLGITLGSNSDGTLTVQQVGSGYVINQVVQIVQYGINLDIIGSAIAQITGIDINGGISTISMLSSGGGFTDLTANLQVIVSGFGGTGSGGVISAKGFVNAVVIIPPGGTGYTLIPTINFTSTSGTGANATAVLARESNSVTINNGGALNLFGNINTRGNFIQTGSGVVNIGNTVVNPVPDISLNSAGGDVFFNTFVDVKANFTVNSSINGAVSGAITFNNTVDSLTSKNLTIIAGISGQGLQSGNVLLKGTLGINPMGDVLVSNSNNFGVIGNVIANTLVVNGANGSVTFSGTLDTSGALSLETINASGLVVLQNSITTGGNVVIRNSGSFITNTNSNFVITGSFSQTGSGSSFISGNITTTLGGINFLGPVSFSGKPLFSARNNTNTNPVTKADIIFQNDVNGLGGISLEATGRVLFLGNIGLLNPLSTIEIVNAGFTNSLDLIAVQFNSSSGQRINSSNILITNANGRVVFNGVTNISNTITTTSNIYDVVFNGNTTVGANANFINGGKVTLASTTNFNGSAFFSNAGTLDASGTIIVNGSLNVQRPLNISNSLQLFLTGPNNTFGSIVTGNSQVTINNGGTLVVSGNSPQFTGNFVVKSSVVNSVLVPSVLQISALYTNASVTLNGGTLTGAGRVLNVNNSTGGTINPGVPLGKLTVGNQLNLASSNTYLTTINGSSQGTYGQTNIISGGFVNINSANLAFVLNANLQVGNQLTLLNIGTGSGALGNFTFNGVPLLQGGSISLTANGFTTAFSINYRGGDGNDVVLTVTAVSPYTAPPGTLLPTQVTGVDYGGGSVVQINYNNGSSFCFYAYSPAYTGGVRVALGDINGDGIDELITGTGIGGGPHIKVFNLQGGQPVEIASFFAFEPTFMGGVYISTGDINADGLADIIVGAGAGGGPRVKVFSGNSGYFINTVAPLMDFFAYNPAFTGGVTVAAGNRDLNPGDEVITGPAVGGGPNVRSFNAASLMIDNFFAFGANITTGIFVAAGYVDSDATADIIAGTGFGAPSQIAAFFSTGARPTAIPFAPNFIGGARVGIALNSLGQEAFAAAAGPGGAPLVNIFNNSLTVVVDTFFAINPLFSGGLYLNTTL